MTALTWTSQSGHTAAAQALIGAGADVNLQQKVSGDGQCNHALFDQIV
jgi:ankyrin repeat protein